MRFADVRAGLCLGACIGGLAALASPAHAGDLALDRFHPAPAGDRLFGVQSPYVAGDFAAHAMLLADYAHNPLVLKTKEDERALGSIVEHQMLLHVNASLALWRRLLVNVDVPAALVQYGASPQGGGATFTSPDAVDFGDLRAGLRLRLYGDYDDPFQLALGGYVWFPTGTGPYVTDGTVRGLPQVIAGGKSARLVWSAAVGPEIRTAQSYFDRVPQGMSIYGGGGVAMLFGDERRFQIGPEFMVSTVLTHPDPLNTNAEVILAARYRFHSSFEVGAGLGPGITSGVGTPDFRGIVMMAYSPEVKVPPPDRDRDGIADPADACPDTPGKPHADPKKNGCPPPAPLPPPPPKPAPADKDKDKDGVLDAKDACPSVAGVADDDPKKNGCPRDTDGDGIADAVDACPDVKGVAQDDPKKNGCPRDKDSDGIADANDACPDVAGIKSSDPARNGCPGDTDSDGIVDAKDACPDEKGEADADPAKNGCPKAAVRVTATEIVILQQVQFDTGSANIKPISYPLLNDVAQALKEHPEILKIEVQGHTDNTGPRELNVRLSQERAAAVRNALVDRKIERDRLTAKGYGPDEPVEDNGTDAGRRKNRRVQFKIMEKDTKGTPR
jgi:outer membrane protein OmpA-like peptidoglycan-associated protein